MTGQRYSFGPSDAKGQFPVIVDGAPVGSVRRLGRSWFATGTGEREGSDHATKAAAAERLVAMVDVRATVECERERRCNRRVQGPDGWTFVPWKSVSAGDVVRLTHRALPIVPGEPALYPDTFSRPVIVGGVEFLANGCAVAHGQQEGDPSPYVLLMLPEHVAIGALVESATSHAPGVPA